MAQPAFNAYTIREYDKDGKKEGFWTKIGVAFPNADGEGFNIILDAFPIDGKITLRKPKAKEEGGQPG